MDSPEVKSNWVLQTHNITGIPASSLTRIARKENIDYKFHDIFNMPKLSGLLVYKGAKKVIIINTHIPNNGRQYFTFAHELGHYFLGHLPTYESDEETSFKCMVNDIKIGSNKQEQEANRFASSLLMPEVLFKPMLAGSPLDFTLISSLAREFLVSKHACANRILDFIKEPYVIITSEGFKITTQKASPSAQNIYTGLRSIPQNTTAYATISNRQNQMSFSECNPQKWLAKATPNIRLYECTRGRFKNKPSVAMTILRWDTA